MPLPFSMPSKWLILHGEAKHYCFTLICVRVCLIIFSDFLRPGMLRLKHIWDGHLLKWTNKQKTAKAGAQLGGPGVPVNSSPLIVSLFLSKQPTTGGENDMKIWWVPSLWHSVTSPAHPPRPLKNLDYALQSWYLVLLTVSIPNTITANIQIRLLLEDIQQLKAKVKKKYITFLAKTRK